MVLVEPVFSHCCIVFDLVNNYTSRTTFNPTSSTFVSTHTVRPTTLAAASSPSSFDREMSRKRKYRQLCSGINAYYEPALRYWKRARTFFQHAVIPLQLNSDTLTTRSTEISFQQQYRPQLNHPWINPLLRRHGLRVPQYNIPTTRHGPIGMTRLHRHRRRLERRHTQECILDLHLLKTLDVLHLGPFEVTLPPQRFSISYGHNIFTLMNLGVHAPPPSSS